MRFGPSEYGVPQVEFVSLVQDIHVLSLVEHILKSLLSKLLAAFIEPFLELLLVLGNHSQERLVLF